LQKEGLVKSIGVSNFTVAQLEDLLADTQTVPAVHQVEFHPYLYQSELFNYCTSKGIVLTAYSPLGAAKGGEGVVPLLQNETVKSIADELNRTPAQVLIRWSVQKGIAVIPKSSNEERLRSNFAVFDFELTADHVARLDALNHNFRFCRSFIDNHWD